MKQLKFFFLIISLIMILSNVGWGQVNISSGNTITESFSIGTSTPATLPTGWKVDKNASVRTLGTYSSAVTSTENRAGNNMSSTAANGIYNYGAGDAASATDRAVGWISSKDATKSGNLYVYLSNNGSSTISNFTISYNVEKYRNGTNSAGFSIQMYYSTNAGSNWTSAGNDFLTSFAADANNDGFNPAPGATVNVSNKTLNISVPANSSIYLAWNYSVTSTSTTTSNAQGLGIDDVSITANASSTTPTIALNTTGFSGDFGSIAIGSSSSSSSFNVSGSNLTSDISVTPPTGFEIRTGTNAFSTSSITLTQSGGTVNSTTIDARFTPTISGLQSGNIAITSTGATTQNVAVSGTGYTAPTTQASNITFSSVQSSQMTVNWTNGDGAKRIVIMNTSNSFTNPSDGTDPSANTVYSGSGEQVVYNNNSNSVTVTGLTANTTYWYRVYEYNGSGTGTKYFTSTATDNPNSQATTSNLPTLVVNPTSLTGFSTEAGTASANQTYTISGSYLNPTEGQITIESPTNFEVSSDGTDYSTSISVTYTGGTLNSTTIYVRVASNSTTGSISGNVSNSGGGVTSAVNVALSGFVYASKPTTQPTNLVFANVTTNSFDLSWTNGNGSNTIVLIKSGSAVNSDPVTGTSYTANANFGSGDQIGSGNYVIYNSTETSVSVTGLSASTTYYVALYSFNGSGSTVNYLTTNPLTGNQTTSTPAVTTYTWTGAAGDGLWSTANNWSGNTVPTTTDGVLLDNSTINGSYTVTLPTGTVKTTILRLTITPTAGNNITLILPSDNTYGGASDDAGLVVGDGTSGTDDIILNNGAILMNSSGASKGNGIMVNLTGGTVRINNGGKYVHNTGRSTAGIVPLLSTATGTELGEFEYDVPGNSFTISASGRTYGSLTLTKTSGTGTYSSSGGSPLTIKGNFKLNTGVTYTTTMTGAMNISGNIINNGADLDISTSTQTVNLNGTSTQNISGTNNLTFGNLTINNLTGVTLARNITVNGTLTLTDGNISTGTNTLYFGTSATNPVESSGKTIIGTAVMNSRTVGTGALNFLSANIAAGDDDLGNVVITRKTGPTVGVIIIGTNSTIASNWFIEPTTQPTTNGRNVTFSWLSDFDNGKNFSTTNKGQVWISTDNGANWAQSGLPVDVSGSDPRTITNNNVTHFSNWVVSSQDAPMPVTLASLTSNVNGRNIVLNWSTSSEINNAGFDVERKSATGDWQKTGYVKGNGTTNETKTYSYKDMNLQTGKYYYRLKQIDYNGNFEYHNLTDMIEVGVPEKFALSQNYPNPFNPVTKINFDLPKDSKVDMRIYDMLGREVALLLNEVKTAGYYTINFNASRLSSGIYFYRLSTGDFSSVKKLVVIK